MICFPLVFCRKIEIDIEELECEGIEPILIDWQGGFVGSVANDLMWAMYPFFERDKQLGKKVRFGQLFYSKKVHERLCMMLMGN